MNKNDILDAIKSLAMSQGFYGRLLRDIQSDIDEFGESDLLNHLEAQNFNDTLDIIFYLEC
jgi:hypothetical protein